jgi:hypothetical protein
MISGHRLKTIAAVVGIVSSVLLLPATIASAEDLRDSPAAPALSSSELANTEPAGAAEKPSLAETDAASRPVVLADPPVIESNLIPEPDLLVLLGLGLLGLGVLRIGHKP